MGVHDQPLKNVTNLAEVLSSPCHRHLLELVLHDGTEATVEITCAFKALSSFTRFIHKSNIARGDWRNYGVGLPPQPGGGRMYTVGDIVDYYFGPRDAGEDSLFAQGYMQQFYSLVVTKTKQYAISPVWAKEKVPKTGADRLTTNPKYFSPARQTFLKLIQPALHQLVHVQHCSLQSTH